MHLKFSLYLIYGYKETHHWQKQTNKQVIEVKNFFRMIITVKIFKELASNWYVVSWTSKYEEEDPGKMCYLRYNSYLLLKEWSSSRVYFSHNNTSPTI